METNRRQSWNVGTTGVMVVLYKVVFAGKILIEEL
jgi:hypothetical protein